MGLFFVTRKEFNIMRQADRKTKKRVASLESRMTGCDAQHQTHIDHNRRHDDATKSLTKAIEDLTLVIQNIKKEKEADNVIISRAKNNYTAWDVIVDTSKQVGAIAGGGAIVVSAIYGVLHYLGILH